MLGTKFQNKDSFARKPKINAATAGCYVVKFVTYVRQQPFKMLRKSENDCESTLSQSLELFLIKPAKKRHTTSVNCKILYLLKSS